MKVVREIMMDTNRRDHCGSDKCVKRFIYICAYFAIFRYTIPLDITENK